MIMSFDLKESKRMAKDRPPVRSRTNFLFHQRISWLVMGFKALLLLGIAPGIYGSESTVIGLVGESAELLCNVDVTSCGEVYFITWTKNVSNEWKRLYLYSDAVEKPLQELANPDRADFFIKKATSFLRISPLRIEDEGEYKCDVTYLQGKCPSLSYATLITHAKPRRPMIEKDGKSIYNGSTVGPFHEGSSITLECESRGGKPAPEITWWQGSDILDSTFEVVPEKNGAFTVTSTVTINIERDDLGARIECHVDNDATDDPLVAWVMLDVQVGPSSLEVTGPTTPVTAGDTVTLSCIIEGAKPAANATWYNRSEVLRTEPNMHTELLRDGTFRTVSEVEIVASRHDHQGTYFCKGTNQVLQTKGEAPLLKSVDLHVQYPPAVIVQPSGGIIINESDSVSIYCTYEANPFNITEVEWFKGDEELDVPMEYKYEQSNQGYPQLIIRNVNQDDRGMYSCSLKNSVGWGNASNEVEINVLFPPRVEANLSPETVSEGNSVSLFCDIMEGNPQNLLRVRWYQDDDLMNETTEKEIVWLDITRNITGNYSCEGENAAGWGERSEAEELIVNFLPGPAELILLDDSTIKGNEVVLHCDVEDLGQPSAAIFRWEQDGELLLSTSENYTIGPLELTSRGNYSCSAVNDVGMGPRGYLYLAPKASPSFIEDLPNHHGAARDDPFISVSCRVECDPLCEIQWFRNGESIMDNRHYIVRSTILPEDAVNNHFISVSSTLKWNMTTWPGRRLERHKDNANYTCTSTGNEVGEGISSTMVFQVEYPPEQVTVSNEEIEVIEGEIPDEVTCTASSWPESTFTWRYGSTVVSGDSSLFLNVSLPREKGGIYKCVAANRHGQGEAETFINVLYRPDCVLYESANGRDETTLVCQVEANPAIVNFTWMRNNETLDEDYEVDGTRSVFTLPDQSMKYYGVYTCIAENEIGESIPCELEVTGMGWVPDLGDKNVFIIAAAIGVVAIVFVLVVIIIIIIMKRKRMQSTISGKTPQSENFYQNISPSERKQNGPPSNEQENSAMYENMPFHRQGPYRPESSDEMLYADLYDDVKSGKVPDPRMKPPLPPKGIGKKPKEPPLPPKMRKDDSSDGFKC